MKAITQRILDNRPVDESIEAIKSVINGGIDSENIKFERITGTTNIIPESQGLMYHLLKAKPSFWLPVTGNIYVHEMTAQLVDVRSVNSSEVYEILIVR